ncbi:glycosyltransferase [Candidatus Roizmanbacteria bacterium CG_4_10_14_0_8_um_filter_39_9]|uniref:Glycosyltransferase n=1 Tax=Candidatus Roizmanbacteria bacterium CG_4_10_14_0_8_um_filter_39_9 TaxID=1974829 RepID=A0A2M7QBB3_9BACT|nr:MAG: glycosyltransferase [Candidatus Roizmanbacteria bacterium CG_4_10_14_0_8_um_filter_39_9]
MISIIIPFFNEEQNIVPLVKEIEGVMKPLNLGYEVIFVNDGSTDKSVSFVKKECEQSENIHLFGHKKRLGKGEALQTGITNSSGEIIIFMDGDLQDDPHDIPHFLKKIDEGALFVNGVRKIRKDNSIIRFYSGLVNGLLKKFMDSPFTDINCGFKAFKREILTDIPLYGNNFRFLPLAAFYKGYGVTQIEVSNRPRIHGVSKFGISKLLIGIFDTLTAYFLFRFSQNPLHFFGTIGAVAFGLGFIISFYLAIERIFFNVLLYRRPLLQLGIVLIIVGIQIIMTGIIGELIVYLHKQNQNQN